MHYRIIEWITYKQRPQVITAAGASSDGHWVVFCIGRRSNTEDPVRLELNFENTETRTEVRPPFGLSSDAYGCVFTPDSKRLLVVTTKGEIIVFSVPDFQLIRDPIDSGHPIQPSRLSPDGRWLATGSADGWVMLWIPKHWNLDGKYGIRKRGSMTCAFPWTARFWQVVQTTKPLRCGVPTLER
jgi:WD40 repeat protein